IAIENVNLEAFATSEYEGKKVYPSPKTQRLISNKVNQKDFYTQHNIPTALYKRFSTLEALKAEVENGSVKTPFVWKATEGGYDGNGVKVVRKTEDLDTLPETECIAETMIPFKNELAVIVARSAS